ncbi:hypothetical protein HNP77_002052 [Treponema rectale]|uniref:Uncharacterized protein n=1 Tax=Treponema rectale TaxID=744512 RepID=A0A840SG04_9SPIR|nr:hypothetical protein [Treponema rectale]MBB5219670.1 hypothetical protein [Treponema rectale]
MEKMTIEEVKEEAKKSLLIEFNYKGNNYTVSGGEDAKYWIFFKNEEKVGSVYGFNNVFTYKFVEGKSIVELFDEIEPSIEFD